MQQHTARLWDGPAVLVVNARIAQSRTMLAVNGKISATKEAESPASSSNSNSSSMDDCELPTFLEVGQYAKTRYGTGPAPKQEMWQETC